MRTIIFVILLVILTISISHTKSVEKSQEVFSPADSFKELHKTELDNDKGNHLAKKRSPRDLGETIKGAQDIGGTAKWISDNYYIVIAVAVVILIMIVCCIWDTICCCC